MRRILPFAAFIVLLMAGSPGAWAQGVFPENSIRFWIGGWRRIGASCNSMFTILHALGMLVADFVKSRARLEAEILLLRHQLNIALRRASPDAPFLRTIQHIGTIVAHPILGGLYHQYVRM
jgi:hypothetical protein